VRLRSTAPNSNDQHSAANKHGACSIKVDSDGVGGASMRRRKIRRMLTVIYGWGGAVMVENSKTGR
jgi:hypothetical protein